MDGNVALARLFSLQLQYRELYARYLRHGINTTLNTADKESPLNSESERAQYFSIGADALRIVVYALLGASRPPPARILDFPSGSGRVARHLRAFFPEARVVACDLYKPHVRFCIDVLGTAGLLSRENFNEVDFGECFDLIFCGSLLTHLPDDLFRAALALLSRSLSDAGIAVITTHGRHSEYIQAHKWKYLDDRLFAIAQATVPETGFGFVNYSHGHPIKSPGNQTRYGISLSRPHWTLNAVEDDYGVRVLGYAERFWDDHQDVLVLAKPGVNDD